MDAAPRKTFNFKPDAKYVAVVDFVLDGHNLKAGDKSPFPQHTNFFLWKNMRVGEVGDEWTNAAIAEFKAHGRRLPFVPKAKAGNDRTAGEKELAMIKAQSHEVREANREKVEAGKKAELNAKQMEVDYAERRNNNIENSVDADDKNDDADAQVFGNDLKEGEEGIDWVSTESTKKLLIQFAEHNEFEAELNERMTKDEIIAAFNAETGDAETGDADDLADAQSDGNESEEGDAA